MAYEGGIFMTRKGALGFEIISEYLGGKMSRKEAAVLLEVEERSVTRMAARVRAKGLLGMVHGNRGRAPAIKTPDLVKAKIMRLVRERYFDFNMTHGLEQLKERHGLEVSYTTFRRWCHERGLVKRSKRRRGLARQYRERMPNEGLLLQMDGSPHRWNQRDVWHLIASIDDATSEVPHAEFFKAEDTLSTMTVLRRVIERKGIPFAVYVDRAGCFGGGGKRVHFNQFKRACAELGIKVLFASSPEAKGRIERAFDTFQDRLIPELRINDIWRMDKANEYLIERFLPQYWDRKVRVVPRLAESKYRPLPRQTDLNEIFCLKYRRLVNGDHTVQWRSKSYALNWPRRRSIRGHKIEFRVYSDGSWRAFHDDDPTALTPVLKPIKAIAKKLNNPSGGTKCLAN